jgi:type II secretory ATPase GspE/PulE/Tfp pilus assembly ATPase PilB-like protein
LPGERKSREGLQLPGRWLRAEFIPFDEMIGLEAGGVRLSSGTLRRLPAPLRPFLDIALSPPASTGNLSADAESWRAYTEGPWSPRRAGETLLTLASESGASDVHIEADGGQHRVRLRLCGDLRDLIVLPAETGRRLIAALKHLSGCLPYRSDVVQEGRIPRAGVAADVRTSFLPTALGERVALRLFGRLYALEELGLSDDLAVRMAALLRHSSGLIIIAGPSGGGKTTTVYAALSHLTTHRSGAHLSIEDPVEQRLRLAGIPVDQVELCPARGLTAEAALVGALRQDVDVVALGEVRTAAEAALALEAAHTGRLVIIGLHAGSTAEASQRMRDLGADPAVLSQTLRGVLHQHLAAAPCPDGDAPDCPRCGGSGQIRTPIATLWTREDP